MNRAVQTVYVSYGGLEGTCCQTYVIKSNGESQNTTPYAKNKLEETSMYNNVVHNESMYAHHLNSFDFIHIMLHY